MNARDELIGKVFPVLDDGHVILLDVMGDDQAIVDAARTTRSPTGRRAHDGRGLIRYLMRNWHSTPFEMAELKFHFRMPMDCNRQHIRHRTASTNEYSTRYAEAIDSAQKTDSCDWRLQSTVNRQGSSGHVRDWPAGVSGDDSSPGAYLTRREAELQEQARSVYEERLRFGVAREQARKDLPLSTYTELVWKIDLHNLLHYLRLRMDSHAQQEIRSYATVIGREIVAPLFPWTWEAFEDYRLGSVTFSRPELEMLKHLNQIDSPEWSDVADKFGELGWKPDVGEGREFLDKARGIDAIPRSFA